MNICALPDETKYLIKGNHKIIACILTCISLFQNLGDFFAPVLGVK